MHGRLASAVVITLVAGCGDNLPTATIPDAGPDSSPPMGDPDGGPGDPLHCAPEPAPTPFRTIELADLPAPAGCVAATADRFAGRWEFKIPGYGFETAYRHLLRVVGDRIDIASFENEEVRFDGTTLFWRLVLARGDQHEVIATRACMTASGELAVTHMECSSRDEQCETEQGKMVRWQRLRGEAEASGLELVGEARGGGIRGAAVNVTVVDGYAYVAEQQECLAPGLRIFDVRDPARPVEVGSYDIDYGANDVEVVVAGDRRYAIVSDENTSIIDVTDPAAPRLAGSLREYSHSVFLERRGGRSLIYLANYGAYVPVFDVTDPEAPVLLGRRAFSPEEAPDLGIHDLYVEDGIAYVNGTFGGFLVVDLRDSIGQGRLLGSTPADYSHQAWVAEIAGRRLAVHGDEGDAAHLRVIDVDPASPTFMADLATYETRPEVSIHNMQIVGDLAYVTYYQDGLRLVDLSTPTASREIAHFNTWDLVVGGGHFFSGAIGVFVPPDEQLIYVADTERGLLVLRRTR